MGLWVALLITLAVFGSVLWVMPSPREKSLTAMRARALELGLKVRLLDEKLAKSLFYWIDNYRPYTLYECLLPREAKPSSHKARVIRLSVDHDAHELDARDELKEALEKEGVFEGLPETCEALVISQGGLAMLWREQQKSPESLEEVESVKRCLESC
ncbi:hypothetical protein A3740_20935, partial [Oleiphilus sp. HI0068]